MHDLTAFQRDVLYIVAGYTGDPAGLRIKEQLGDLYDRDVNHGQLYPNLDALAEMGLLDKRKRNERTNEYRVTDAGVEAMQDRIDWEREKVQSLGVVA